MCELKEMTKEQLMDLYIETSADLCVALNSKKVVLEKNKALADMVVRLEAENAQLIMLARRNGLL